MFGGFAFPIVAPIVAGSYITAKCMVKRMIRIKIYE
jgi:hypothetical protein